MITLYGINNCDTIKKTRQWLEDKGLEYQFHNYKILGCSDELITCFLEQFCFRELINTRGTTWRNLPENVKKSLSREDAIILMKEKPSIIKRPRITRGNQWILGFDLVQLARIK